MSKWSRIGAGSSKELARFSGKTFPSIVLVNGKLYARNDNGNAPSKTIEAPRTSDGVQQILNGINGPYPSSEDIKWLLEK
jgi:hypothetical protein